MKRLAACLTLLSIGGFALAAETGFPRRAKMVLALSELVVRGRRFGDDPKLLSSVVAQLEDWKSRQDQRSNPISTFFTPPYDGRFFFLQSDGAYLGYRKGLYTHQADPDLKLFGREEIERKESAFKLLEIRETAGQKAIGLELAYWPAILEAKSSVPVAFDVDGRAYVLKDAVRTKGDSPDFVPALQDALADQRLVLEALENLCRTEAYAKRGCRVGRAR